MATSARRFAVGGEPREAFPSFDLTYRYDGGTGTELTVYPESATADRTTAWITIDADHAVPLESIR